MGKMIIGSKGQSTKQNVYPGTKIDPTNVANQLGLTIEGKSVTTVSKEEFDAAMTSVMEKHAEVFKRLAESDIQANMVPSEQLQVLQQKVVEKVITKDKRSRQHTKLVNDSLKRQRLVIKALGEAHEATEFELKNLKAIVYKLQTQQAELDKREKALEAVIPEENQEVKQSSPTLLYLGLAASILMSLAALIK